MSEWVTRERILEILDYDPETGIFTWKHRPNHQNARGISVFNKRFAGTPAGTIDGSERGQKYRFIGISGKIYRSSHLAWVIATGSWPKGQIDHRDVDGLNDRLENLREATGTLNCANRFGRSRQGLPKGVRIAKKKFAAQIGFKRKNFHIGTFDTIEAAHAAYCVAAVSYFGEFARFD